MSERWYTITIVEHAQHPRFDDAANKPKELISCTVLPHLAGSILRSAADEIDPKKPVMRSASEPDARLDDTTKGRILQWADDVERTLDPRRNPLDRGR